MADNQNQATEVEATTAPKKTGWGTLVATAVIAGALGVGGTTLATTESTAPASTPVIDAQVEMQAFTGVVTGVEAVGMVEEGFTPHIHAKFNPVTSAKSYNFYLDGNKVNKDPIVVIGDTGRYTALDLKAGKTYSVTITAVGIDGKESAPSEAVSVTIK